MIFVYTGDRSHGSDKVGIVLQGHLVLKHGYAKVALQEMRL